MNPPTLPTPEKLSEETRLLIERITRALVDHSDEASVTMNVGRYSTVFEIHVAPTDIGKLIGKKGIHVDAIRRLLAAIAGKHARRYTIDVMA